MHHSKRSLIIVSLFVFLSPMLTARGAGFPTALTYQGRLASSGTNVSNGVYDFQFSLWNAQSGGSSVTTTQSLSLGVTNGFVAANVDFGAGVFDGTARWLQIAVRTNGGGSFALLLPRQSLTPTPYALVSSNLAGNLAVTQLTGIIPSSLLSGTYANLDAGTLGGLGAGRFWKLAGNGGTTAGIDFVGTTDNQPLEMKVNGQRAMRLEPRAAGAPNVIGGSVGNSVGGSVFGVTIGGGSGNTVPNSAYTNALYATIGGGSGNTVPLGAFATIAGGSANTVGVETGHGESSYSFVGGGGSNFISSSTYATISGGGNNSIVPSIFHGSDYSTIAGGYSNYMLQAFYATISGGRGNQLYNPDTTIGGGANNTNWSIGATIAGGEGNYIKGGEGISALSATIGGGAANVIGVVSHQATISGGLSNLIDEVSYGATISGGQINAVAHNSDGGAIGGGHSNTLNAVYSTISGGESNRVSGSHGFIGGGLQNAMPAADFGTIAGGFTNTLGAAANFGASPLSFIGGGSNNFILGSALATIAGGANNSMAPGAGPCDYGTVGGGFANYMVQGIGATIAGGISNYTYNFEATIGGGVANTNWAGQATIGGGANNFIYGDDFGASARYATLGGGQRNSIGVASIASTISGGYSNVIDAVQYTTIGGGEQNRIYASSDKSTIGGGHSNTVVFANAGTIGGGATNTVTRPLGTVPGGLQATASHYGQMAYASGDFAAPGDAQTSTYVVRGITTNANLTELFLDGATERMTMPTNSTWGIDALITGRTANGQAAVFQIIGAAKNINGVTTLIGTTGNAFTRKDDATWIGDVVAGPNGVVFIQVKGAAASTVRWVANVRTVEVTF